MTILETWTVQLNAKKDAKAGVESCDDLVSAMLGVRPTFDPARLDHKRVEDDLHLDAEIKNQEDQLQQLEDQRAHEPRLFPMNLVLALCFLCEPFAGISLMTSYGFQNPEKTVFGVMLAACIFAITSIAARMTGRARAVAYLMYAALVVAVAGSRLAERSDGTTTSWAEAAVLVALTIGPAILAEWCWRRRENAAKLAKQIANVGRRLADLRSRHRRAHEFVDRIATAEQRWAHEAAIIRGTYVKDHRRLSASAGGAWPVHTAPRTN